VSHRGAGSTITITRQEYLVKLSFARFIDAYSFTRSDLKGIGDMTFSFELGAPFKPFEQLMGVLPEASKELIPLAYQVTRMK
jgi:hypothetical protein